MVVVPVILPAQLSLVIGAVTDAEHSPVTVTSVGATGAVTSSTTTVCFVVHVLPLPSLKLQLTVYVPCAV